MEITQRGITEAELIKALREAGAQTETTGAAGLTVTELSDLLSLSKPTVRQLLRPLVEEGRVQAARGYRKGIHGFKAATYVYQLAAP